MSKYLTKQALLAVMGLSLGFGLALPGFAVALSDSEITARVRENLAGVESLKGATIGVKTTDGVVHLSGDLQSQDAVDRIKDLVAQVDGVKSVNTVGLDSPYVTMVW